MSTHESDAFEFITSKRFSVPDYQRGYAWKAVHVEDLLSDIEYLTTSSAENDHYFGTIVICETTNDASRRKVYNIIDGQQRLTTYTLIASFLTTELNRIDNENHPVTNDLQKSYYEDQAELRIKMDKEKEIVYKNLVEESGYIGKHNITTSSEYNLKEAKKAISEWFAHKRKQMKKEEYVQYLLFFSESFLDGLKVTVYELDDEMEAGRMFSIVNDRGRELNLADKIKSYIIYQSSHMGNEELAQKTYDVFADVNEKVRGADNSTKDINLFVKAHWTLFTGEYDTGSYDIQGINRRLKQSNRHLKQDKQKEDKIEWIEKYLDTIHQSANTFNFIENPYTSNHINNKEIQEKTYVTKELLANNWEPFIIALLNKYKDGIFTDDDVVEILDALETFAMRSHQIVSARSSTFQTKMYVLSYRTQWVGNQEQAEQLFDRKKEAHENASHSKKQILHHAKEKADNYGNAKALLEKDNIVKGGNVPNWGGVRGKFAIRYLLFRYEQSLGNEQITFKDFYDAEENDNQSIEHIIPKESEDSELSEEKHNNNVQSLGNLLILGISDNAVASTKKLSDKWDDVYSDCELKMMDEVREIGEMNGTLEWNEKHVNKRSKKIAKFAGEKW